MSSVSFVVDPEVDDFSVVVVEDCSIDKIVNISVAIVIVSELVKLITSDSTDNSGGLSVATVKLTLNSTESSCIVIEVVSLVAVKVLSSSVEDVSSVVIVKLAGTSVKSSCVVVKVVWLVVAEVVWLVVVEVVLASSVVVETTVVVVVISLFCSF